MLVSQHPVLRRFWYLIILVEALQSGPKRFVLLGSPLVLWLDGVGQPACVKVPQLTSEKGSPLALPVIVVKSSISVLGGYYRKRTQDLGFLAVRTHLNLAPD